MKNKIILLTGVTGFVGRGIYDLLIGSGYTVKVLVRSISGKINSRYQEEYIIDENYTESNKDAFHEIDAVIHCAGDAKFGNGKNYENSNVRLTEFIVNETITHAKNAKFIYISTIGVVDRAKNDTCQSRIDENFSLFPSSDYGYSKLKAELIVKESGLIYTIIRPAMVVGSGMRIDSHFSKFAQMAIKKKLLSRINWTGKFSVVHIEDLAKAVVLSLSHVDTKNTTLMCAGDEIELGVFLEMCSPGTLRVPIRWALPLAFILRKHLPFKLKILLFPALVASDGKLRGLGWKPSYSAQESLAQVVQRELGRVCYKNPPLGVTVITGAASGLGMSIAKKLANIRSELILIDINKYELEKLSSAIENSKVIVADLSDKDEVVRVINTITENSKNISELFACAGIGQRGRIDEIDGGVYERIFSLNLISRINLAKSLIIPMKLNKFGRVVFISSSSAFQPLPLMAIYSATNTALLSIGQSWSWEIKKSGVHIMTACPGGMQTNFQKNNGVKKLKNESLMNPDLVAEKILNSLSLQKTVLIISIRSHMMSLLSRVLPRSINLNIWGLLMSKMR